ncbi:MAG TPA: DivIVA domain-containing protein [Vicinamibacterales bacterium]|jgi:cell division initiation protein|nr:DivIVA domain-containing protein [Vicinamibacterales bacterium]
MLNNEDLTPAVETRRLPSPDRHSAPTPLDVRQAKFSTSMRGYERAEVNAFLLEAADGYEQATRENERLRQDVARLEASLSQYRELEGALKGALMSAQKVSDDMKETASLDAARIIREAEGRAELITQKAQAALEDVQREIDGLRLKRRESEVALESIIAALHNTLEFVREQDQREQHRIIPHRTMLNVAQPA